MSEPGVDADIAPLLFVSLVIARDERIALLLGRASAWRAISGYTLIPAALPAGHVELGVAPAAAAEALGLRWLGVPVSMLPSEHLYGASAEHAIDRLPTSGEDAPLPLLRIERRTPRDDGTATGPPRMQRVIVRAYRAAFSGEPHVGDGASGVLWLAPAALRLVMRGAPLADLLALPTVAYHPAPDVALPDDAFVYAPAEYGERALLRIVAKYEPAALFQSGGQDLSDGPR